MGKYYLKIPELAQKLSVKESWIRNMVFKSQIPFLKLGHFIRFCEDDINKWLDDKKFYQKQTNYKENRHEN